MLQKRGVMLHAVMQSTAEYLAHTELYVDLLCQNLEAGSLPDKPVVHAMQLASLQALQEHMRLW